MYNTPLFIYCLLLLIFSQISLICDVALSSSPKVLFYFKNYQSRYPVKGCLAQGVVLDQKLFLPYLKFNQLQLTYISCYKSSLVIFLAAFKFFQLVCYKKFLQLFSFSSMVMILVKLVVLLFLVHFGSKQGNASVSILKLTFVVKIHSFEPICTLYVTQQPCPKPCHSTSFN